MKKTYVQPALLQVETNLQVPLAQSPNSITVEFNGFKEEVAW